MVGPNEISVEVPSATSGYSASLAVAMRHWTPALLLVLGCGASDVRGAAYVATTASVNPHVPVSLVTTTPCKRTTLSDLRSVVQVLATTQRPDYDNPWQSHSAQSSIGSGVVIAPSYVLTGAHVVADATFLQVQKNAVPDKMLAQVVAISHDSDLALLRVDDPLFMDGVEPECLGQLPNPRDPVTVVGYPIGGEEVSYTEGVVSRVELQRYGHSERDLLAITVDAAINDGNSGGPVFKDGAVVGIAFQAMESAENIGEMVPTNLIRNFLSAVQHGKPPAIPDLGIRFQNLENPALRDKVGLARGESGVLVTAVDHGSSAWGALEPGDALLAIEGKPIANNGTVEYQARYRTGFAALLSDHHIGDSIAVDVLRGGNEREVKLELQPFRRLVARSQYDTEPSYFVYAGLVFQPLSVDYLGTWGQWQTRAPAELRYLYTSGLRTAERHEVVIITGILADAINTGYGDFDDQVIATVNGAMPRDLRDFVHRVEISDGPVELATGQGAIIVIDPGQASAARERIATRYRLPRDRSRNLEATPSQRP